MIRDQLVRRYMQLRAAAYANVTAGAETAGVNSDAFRLTGLTTAALTVWERTWAPRVHDPAQPGGWDWVQIAEVYARYPDAFQVAIWSDSALCGLSVGRPSRGHHYLAVDFLEGSPVRNRPLRGQVLPLVVAAASAYARILGATSLRLVNPLPGVIPLYEQLGFTLVWGRGSGQYCERRI